MQPDDRGLTDTLRETQVLLLAQVRGHAHKMFSFSLRPGFTPLLSVPILIPLLILQQFGRS